jgi:hypothetical protein
MAPVNSADFLRLLEAHLQPLHVPFSRSALQAFVEACWPWMEDDPDVEMWAEKFLATGDVMAPACVGWVNGRASGATTAG